MKLRLWLALGALLVCAPGSLLARAGGEDSPAPPDAPTEVAPVEIDGRQLFRVIGVSSFPAERRAGEIRERIQAAAADPAVTPESIVTVEGPLGSEIRAGETRLLILTDDDARVEGAARPQLAAVWTLRVREAIVDWRAERTKESLLVAARSAIVALVLFAVVLLLIEWLWRKLSARLQRRLRERVRGVAIGSFEVVRAERIWLTAQSIFRTLHWLVLVGLTFSFLVYSLRQFPWTRHAGANLAGWVLNPLTTLGSGLLGSVPNLIFLAVLFVVTRWGLKLVRLFFEAVGRGEVELSGFDSEWALPTYKLVRIGIVAFAVIVAYPYIPGSESPAFKGVSLFLGLVFSLSSSSALANIIAGYSMTYRRAFKEGDVVRIGSTVGRVAEIRLQVTNLRTPKNEIAVIPNSTILNSEVVNYSALAKTEGLILHTTVGIGYETPWRQVEAMLLLAAERTEGVLTDRKPFVHQKALADFAVTYELNVYTDDWTRIPATYTALHRQILDVFNEFGVQIMTPAYEGDPEVPKVVARDQWFTSPAAPAAPGAPASPGSAPKARGESG